MTISYSGNFARLLLRWKGSLWKAVWKEMLVFWVLYFLVRFVQKILLTSEQEYVVNVCVEKYIAMHRVQFERLLVLFNSYLSQIPLTFLLGFYVTMVFNRLFGLCRVDTLTLLYADGGRNSNSCPGLKTCLLLSTTYGMAIAKKISGLDRQLHGAFVQL